MANQCYYIIKALFRQQTLRHKIGDFDKAVFGSDPTKPDENSYLGKLNNAYKATGKELNDVFV